MGQLGNHKAFKPSHLGGTISVKFGIYVRQMTILGGGNEIIVQPILYHPIIIYFLVYTY